MSRNEVAELSEAELICLVYLQLGTLGSKKGRPKGSMNYTVDQEWNIQPWCVVLFAVGEKYEGLQKRLSRNEVAELSRGGINTSSSFATGNPWV